MYPRLSDLLSDLFGINIPLPIQTYGFFVAMAFVTGSVILYFELKRKERIGILQPIEKDVKVGYPPSVFDTIFTILIGFVLGYKFGDAFFRYSDFVANPQDFLMSGEGNLTAGIVLAIAFAVAKYIEFQKAKKVKKRIEKKTIHPQDISWNILIVATLAGILGAKLFHLLENMGDLINDPIGTIFSFSGLTFFGGMICGSIAVLLYARRFNIGSLHLIDAGAPGIALAYGVGRIGCQLSGDGCWGIANTAAKPGWMSFLPDWMWSFKFPNNVINEGVRMTDCHGTHCSVLPEGVFPTSFYEMLMMFSIFAILWAIRSRVKIPGAIFAIFLFLIGIERFFIEKIRVNNEYDIFGFGITQAEIISSVLILLGISGFFLLRKYKDRLMKNS